MVAPARRCDWTDAQAERMAFTSAWAVASWAARTLFPETARISPLRTMQAPKGPPAPEWMDSYAASRAACIQSRRGVSLELIGYRRMWVWRDTARPCPGAPPR